MGMLDLFKATKNRELNEENEALKSVNENAINENNQLKKELTELKELLQPEHTEFIEITERLKNAKAELEKLNKNISEADADIEKLKKKKSELDSQIIETDEKILLQSMGVYEPTFDFATSDDYKKELKRIRDKGKTLIKDAVSANVDNCTWTVNGKISEGRKMVRDISKLLIRAFNTECDELIGKEKHSNFDAYNERLYKSFESINKYGKVFGISIDGAYMSNRRKELRLAYEYAVKKQQEKEEQREARERMREEAKLQKEIEEARKNLYKEQKHYNNALEKLEARLEQVKNPEEEKELLEKKTELLDKMSDIDKAIKDVDYREANKRAGYVYIISNIGSFGENVYKIGMTRRLDPMERVYELGDASVPYNFDVHAMIFCDDAPTLETALHKAFEDKKVNMINQRREFFHVTLDEIKKVIKANYDKTVEFIDIPEAEQYRMSEKMRKEA